MENIYQDVRGFNLYKISVILSVYNVENYIAECIDSLIAQELKEIEIIIIDDASTDKSYEICSTYSKKNENIKLLRKDKNSGQSDSKNLGIEVSSGEFIAFIDGDDYIFPDMLRKLYESNDKSNIISCNIVNQFGRREFDYFYKSNYLYDRLEIVKEIIPELVLGSLEGFVTGKIFNANFIKNNNIKFNDPPMYEDKIFMMDCFNHTSSFKYIDVDGYVYRQHYYNSIKKYNENMLYGLNNIYEGRIKLLNLYDLNSEDNMIACRTRYTNDLKFLINRISLYNGNLKQKKIFLAKIKLLLKKESSDKSDNVDKHFLWETDNVIILNSFIFVWIKENMKKTIKKAINYYGIK